jgi:hypothetical protein
MFKSLSPHIYEAQVATLLSPYAQIVVLMCIKHLSTVRARIIPISMLVLLKKIFTFVEGFLTPRTYDSSS